MTDREKSLWVNVVDKD